MTYADLNWIEAGSLIEYFCDFSTTQTNKILQSLNYKVFVLIFHRTDKEALIGTVTKFCGNVSSEVIP